MASLFTLPVMHTLFILYRGYTIPGVSHIIRREITGWTGLVRGGNVKQIITMPLPGEHHLGEIRQCVNPEINRRAIRAKRNKKLKLFSNQLIV